MLALTPFSPVSPSPPQTFSDSELTMLQSPALFNKGKRERENTAKAYDALEPVMRSMISIYTTQVDPTVPPTAAPTTPRNGSKYSHKGSGARPEPQQHARGGG